MIRKLLYILFSFFITAAQAQTVLQVAKFDNTFKLNDGIYTSYEQLLNNAPLFPDCMINLSGDKWDDPDNVNPKKLTYSAIGNDSVAMEFTFPLFATVLKGKLNIFFQKELSAVYSRGTISTFIFVRDPHSQNKNLSGLPSSGFTFPTYPAYNTNSEQSRKNLKSPYKSFICILDIQTGQVTKLTKEDLGLIIKRDSVLCQRYEKIKPGKRNKNLLTFIAEFNQRNPTLIPINNETLVIEEE
ncbi:hypothetical protein [Cytophaga aurantiaca]|uniref:hypothetical protein n=1 Tax=Cytophaga aurantiaca TaxID=29530 RepID=UPI0003A896CB|nr:hypothetical protein [Cytophaga aurantiaca]